MKQCLNCGLEAPDELSECAACGKSFSYYRPVAGNGERGLPVGAPTESALRFLGWLFYVASAANVVWALVVAQNDLAAAVVPLAAAVSALFFGGISFAADDVRQTLRSIDARLAKGSQDQ